MNSNSQIRRSQSVSKLPQAESNTSLRKTKSLSSIPANKAGEPQPIESGQNLGGKAENDVLQRPQIEALSHESAQAEQPVTVLKPSPRASRDTTVADNQFEQTMVSVEKTAPQKLDPTSPPEHTQVGAPTYQVSPEELKAANEAVQQSQAQVTGQEAAVKIHVQIAAFMAHMQAFVDELCIKYNLPPDALSALKQLFANAEHTCTERVQKANNKLQEASDQLLKHTEQVHTLSELAGGQQPAAQPHAPAMPHPPSSPQPVVPAAIIEQAIEKLPPEDQAIVRPAVKIAQQAVVDSPNSEKSAATDAEWVQLDDDLEAAFEAIQPKANQDDIAQEVAKAKANADATMTRALTNEEEIKFAYWKRLAPETTEDVFRLSVRNAILDEKIKELMEIVAKTENDVDDLEHNRSSQDLSKSQKDQKIQELKNQNKRANNLATALRELKKTPPQARPDSPSTVENVEESAPFGEPGDDLKDASMPAVGNRSELPQPQPDSSVAPAPFKQTIQRPKTEARKAKQANEDHAAKAGQEESEPNQRIAELNKIQKEIDTSVREDTARFRATYSKSNKTDATQYAEEMSAKLAKAQAELEQTRNAGEPAREQLRRLFGIRRDK